MRGALHSGHTEIQWSLESDKLKIIAKGTWDSAADEESQGSAHVLGVLSRTAHERGLRSLALDLSCVLLDSRARAEIGGFAAAMRYEGWQITCDLPPVADDESISVSDGHLAFQTVLPGSLAVNGIHHVA